MQIIKPDEKKLTIISLCDVPAGYVFRFMQNESPMLRLQSNCGYCELDEAFESIEELDRELIENNTEKVRVYGKLKSVVVG